MAEAYATLCPTERILEKYAIFSLEQQQVQANCNTGSDLLSYVQMQRNLRLATKVYNDSLQAMSNFWNLLLHHEVQLEDLINCVKEVDNMVKTADIAYKDLFRSSVESWRILKVYAKYLEIIKMDPFNAAKWEADAEDMSASEDQNQTNIFSNTVASSGTHGDNSVTRNRAIFDDHRCAVIINAFGTITMANKGTFAMFGCKLSDLMGKNVRILMPSPFKEHHDQFIKSYVETGKPKAIGRTMEMVAQHSDGHLFSVNVTISKISGLGMDSNFMGVLEALPGTSGARAWLLGDGTVICVADSITQWFGYENAEIARTSFLTLVEDATRLDEILKEASQTNGESCEAAKKLWHLDDIRIKHKFLDHPITCSIDISTGGSDTQSFIILDFERTSLLEPVLVTNSTGHIVHICDETAASLGTTARQLVSEGSFLSLTPEPFSALHSNFLLRGIEADPSDIPPYSCRSGLSMCLNVSGPQGKEMHPFSINFRKNIQSLDGSTQNVITLTKRTMQEALGERCLSVLVDVTGIIRQVAGGHGELFGFAPEELLSKPISSFVDVMASPELQGSSTDNDFAVKALRELASRSVKQPGESYRVGVSRPFGGEGGVEDEFLSDIVSHLRTATKIPAIMKAALHCSDREITRLQEGSKLSTTTPFFDLSQASKNTQGNFMIELQLWKADIMTGVLVLDEQGFITSTSLSPLYPAELLFGVSSAKMVQRHINSFLPLYDRPISDLFDPMNTELGRQNNGGPKKGGMKAKDNSWLRRGPGVVNRLSSVHGTDEQALVLNVQAVAMKGKRGSMGLIVRLHDPVMGNAIRSFLPPSQKGSAAPATLEPHSFPTARAPSPPVLPLQDSRSLASQSMKAPSVLASRKRQFSIGNQSSCSQKGFEAVVDDEVEHLLRPEFVIGVADLAMPAALHDAGDTLKAIHSDAAEHEYTVDQPKLQVSHPSSTGQIGKGKESMQAWVTSNSGNIGMGIADRSIDSTWPSPDLLAQKMQSLTDADDDHREGSEAGTTTSVPASDSGIGAADYKRGKRLKRLHRLLTGAASRQVINRFFFRAAAMAIFICTVTVACFIAAYMLILDQSSMVRSIQNMGFAANSLGKVAIYVNNMLILHSNNTAPWLDNLRSLNDMPFHLDKLMEHIGIFAALHKDEYTFVQKLPPSGTPALTRLHDLWNKPVLPITTIFPSDPVNTQETVNVSLWDAGQSVINKATVVWQNTPHFPDNVVNATTYGEWYEVRFILDNIQDTLIPAYTDCMDNFLEVVLLEAEAVNSIHYYFLVIEGCVASSLAVVVMLVITTQVVVYRWNIYNVFMMIPTTIIRNIATRVVQMMEDGRDGAAALEQVSVK